MAIRLADLAAELGAVLVGDGARTVDGVAPLERAGPSQLSFFSNRKYKAEYQATRAGAVIIGGADRATPPPPGAALLVVDPSYLAFARVSAKFHRPPAPRPGVHEHVVIDPTASVDPTATLLPFCYVGPGAHVGARAVLHAGCVVLDGARIGDDALLYPGCVVREACVVGNRVILQPGAIVGSDGFGFAFDPKRMRHEKVPQVGRAVVSDDVEVGACTCIDRGTLGDTVVGPGAKLDNLCRIAHNVEIGALSLIAGCTAIAGSTKLGTGVVCGGQVGIVGHLDIGDGARFAAKSGVHGNVPKGATMGGWPAVEQKQWLREQAAIRQLPELLREVRALRKRVDELEEQVAATAAGKEG
jgi:UDP-3-O-[3-hydroxymyristoyl] glucosamine N-acyltransferase